MMCHKSMWITVLLLLPSLATAGIVVAQVAAFSGPLADNGTQNWLGAKAYFDRVNATGGVNGEKILFIREDDRYLPEETVRLVALVAARDKPAAFVNLLGSANVKLLMQQRVLDKTGTPVVGVTPGAESLRRPGSPLVFHLHAGDRAQIRELLSHMAAVGERRISVVYQDNPFGKNGLALIEELAGAQSISIETRVAMAVGSSNGLDAAKVLLSKEAHCYVMVLAPNSAAAFVRDLRRAGGYLPIYGLSYADPDLIVKEAGTKGAAGVGLAEVLPNPLSATTVLSREYLADWQRYGPQGSKPSSLSLVGYLAARVTVEALRRAGPAPTPVAVTKTLRGLKRLDVGGYVVNLSPGEGQGSNFVDIAVIDGSGKLRY